jgi:hypothetical protein
VWAQGFVLTPGRGEAQKKAGILMNGGKRSADTLTDHGLVTISTKRARVLGGALLPLLLSIGCQATEEEGETFFSGTSALVSENALLPNALLPNALLPNALLPNALLPNALLPNAMAPNALAAVRDAGPGGDLSRMFLKYTVGCALDPTQSFQLSWTDAAGATRSETYMGVVGTAPEWATLPLDENGQKLVSACLAARTNWYGTPVLISMRSNADPLRAKQKSGEFDTYPDIEGAFWGNLFSTSPYLRACYNPATVANSRSLHRDCAAGHIDANGAMVDCGMIDILGSCADYCKDVQPAGQYYRKCDDPTQGKVDRVVTTALP